MQLEGANCECDRRVWRMDVGMSEGVLNANPQAKRAICSMHACVLPVILLFSSKVVSRCQRAGKHPIYSVHRSAACLLPVQQQM